MIHALKDVAKARTNNELIAKMDNSSPRTNSMLFAFCGFVFSLPAIFFTWYTVRLAYLNLTMPAEQIAQYRGTGMLIGAIVFPIAAIIFWTISWLFIRWARRGFRK